ncbi:aminopeptidase P family protein [Carpediemonas membranifera]|uniref:Aminopeptidase P family protein n=1 Tax=Carpediemonas membranifera TaxID=201153 RepID=A0A8J6AUZ4_9EUKA|nr:aminopeptidase P family protein [Carpediemonas membranifera]|eukprot:KAG9395416.1 aminopeptidase P family protein [Carpediemonas membranifera]
MTTMLERLRAALSASKHDYAFLYHNTDAHNSEYLLDCWNAIPPLTGFTGSNSTIVVTDSEALLWTDSRYWVQAAEELEEGWTLMAEGKDGVPGPKKWLKKQQRRTVLYAKDVNSIHDLDTMEDILPDAELVGVPSPFMSTTVWPDRPEFPAYKAYTVPRKLVGESAEDRVAAVLGKTKGKVEGVVSSSCDAVSWTLLLRGDIYEYTPLAVAHMMITGSVDEATVRLFIQTKDDSPLSREEQEKLQQSLGKYSLEVLPYDGFSAAVSKLGTCALDETEVAVAAKPADYRHKEGLFTAIMRAKSDTELSCFRRAQLVDSAAMCTFLHWLEEKVMAGQTVTELDVGEKLGQIRAEFGAISPSFETIAGCGPNGAIVHYRPGSVGEVGEVTLGQPVLIDSGGQYMDPGKAVLGTTDLTRTLCIGPAPEHFKEAFTAVLLGHIDVADAVFRKGYNGGALDFLARRHLNRLHADYGHGTGHGVGTFLSVHEGDFGVTLPRKSGRGLVPLKQGSVVSDEPGYYRPGAWGIRIESLLEIIPSVKHSPLQTDDFADFLRFETITLVPIQTDHIDVSMMDRRQRAWLNDYHATVREKVTPLVDSDVREWIMTKTSEI